MAKFTKTDWTLVDLQNHLKFAIDLELWTIPFYRVALHAVNDSTNEAQSAINIVSLQEMFHCQCAWNIAQAFGVTDYDFTKRKAFVYQNKTIPHLNFHLENPNPIEGPVTVQGKSYDFSNFSASLNPSTFTERINAMCLVEYPDWANPTEQELKPKISKYPSIGHFYAAIKSLIQGQKCFSDGTPVYKYVTGGTKTQTGLFAKYDFLPASLSEKITESGENGMTQVIELINAIVEEGEGTSSSPAGIPAKYQFARSSEPHFDFFLRLKSNNDKSLYQQKELSTLGVQSIMNAFQDFLGATQTLFTGGSEINSNFMTSMIAFDGLIKNAFLKV